MREGKRFFSSLLGEYCSSLLFCYVLCVRSAPTGMGWTDGVMNFALADNYFAVRSLLLYGTAPCLVVFLLYCCLPELKLNLTANAASCCCRTAVNVAHALSLCVCVCVCVWCVHHEEVVISTFCSMYVFLPVDSLSASTSASTSTCFDLILLVRDCEIIDLINLCCSCPSLVPQLSLSLSVSISLSPDPTPYSCPLQPKRCARLQPQSQSHGPNVYTNTKSRA